MLMVENNNSVVALQSECTIMFVLSSGEEGTSSYRYRYIYIIREPPPPCNAYDMMLIAKGGVGPITTIWVIELRNKCWNCLPFLKGLAYGNTSVPGQHDGGIWNTIETHESIFVHATFNKKWTDGACTIHFSVWGKEILNISIYRDKVLNNVMKFFHTVCM